MSHRATSLIGTATRELFDLPSNISPGDLALTPAKILA